MQKLVKQRQGNVQKSVQQVQSCFFGGLISPIVVDFFTVLVVFTVSLALHDFIFYLSKLLIKASIAISPG